MFQVCIFSASKHRITLKSWIIKLFYSHQYQTGNKNISSEDHYSPAQHSAPKRRKNEFGLPQLVNLTKLPTRPCDMTHSDKNKTTSPGYFNSDMDTGLTRLSPSLELDMENIKDVHNKEPLVLGDRERKFSDSSGSSPSTSVSSSSPKVRNNSVFCIGKFDLWSLVT